MTKLKSKVGKDFNTEWIIDWANWLSFIFFALSQFFQSTNWFWISYFNRKVVQFIYAIREKVFLKDFVLHEGGLITEAGTDFKESFIWEEKSKYE